MKNNNDKKQKNKTFYCSFLTVILLLSTIYLGFSAIYNITKFVSHKKKLMKLETSYKETKETQELLKAEIDSFKSPEAYEAFLRNYLKYAAKDDILVIIIPKKR